ncbi:MAG: discoidin domain-containing protein [Phycisphaerae bacterium]|nr:discoidin domain-containing protein [Phycisphaerae bacterium]
MESRIARYSVAATVLVAASVVLFSPFGGRHAVVLADVAQKLSETRTVMHKEKRLFWHPGEDKPFLESQVRKYISTDIGFVEEQYDMDGKLDHQFFLLKDGQIVFVFPKSKRYIRLPTQGGLYDELLKMSTPAGLVDYFLSMPNLRLGRSQFHGFEADGFAVSNVDFPYVQDLVKYLFPIRNLSAALWMEAESSLPVGIEMRIDADPGFLNGFQRLHAEFTATDFEWDAELPEGILDPNIPADYTEINLGAPAISAASAGEGWTPTTAVPRLWPVEEAGNDHTYQGVPVGERITWTSAEQAATLAGGYLATITLPQENDVVFGVSISLFVQAMGNEYGPWLGGYQLPGAQEPAGGWVWVTGEPFEYTAWARGEPSQTAGALNEDRIHYLGHEGPEPLWNDQANSEGFGPMSYLVEYDPVTLEAENAAVVPVGQTETTYAGYSGDGYVRLTSRPDAICWILHPGMAQDKGILLHYSNGTSQDMHVEIAVNGTVVEPNLVCTPTGAWDVWGSTTAYAHFTSGENVVEIRSLADDAGLVIDRITVFGDNTNLAMDRQIAFSVELPGYPASRAIDADLRTSWRLRELPQWLEVDLGDVYPVYRTQVIGTQGRACRFTVEVKTGVQDEYVLVVDRTGNTTPGTTTNPIVDTFDPTAARYVRLTVTGADGTRSPEVTEFRISAATDSTAISR